MSIKPRWKIRLRLYKESFHKVSRVKWNYTCAFLYYINFLFFFTAFDWNLFKKLRFARLIYLKCMLVIKNTSRSNSRVTVIERNVGRKKLIRIWTVVNDFFFFYFLRKHHITKKFHIFFFSIYIRNTLLRTFPLLLCFFFSSNFPNDINVNMQINVYFKQRNFPIM